MAGVLFFVSTIGSAIGTLGTSFYFVLWFEVNQILWGAIVALLLAGAIVLAADQLLSAQTSSRQSKKYDKQARKRPS